MKTSKNGIELIKRFEGCRLKAYKAVASEKYYTIGYGHYGYDVKQNMSITIDQAESLLAQDLMKYESVVNTHMVLHYPDMNQNQFDALVSFTYNCGISNLYKLTASGVRNYKVIADKILLYNKAGGKVLKGLVNRRKAERDLFLRKV